MYAMLRFTTKGADNNGFRSTMDNKANCNLVYAPVQLGDPCGPSYGKDSSLRTVSPLNLTPLPRLKTGILSELSAPSPRRSIFVAPQLAARQYIRTLSLSHGPNWQALMYMNKTVCVCAGVSGLEETVTIE